MTYKELVRARKEWLSNLQKDDAVIVVHRQKMRLSYVRVRKSTRASVWCELVAGRTVRLLVRFSRKTGREAGAPANDARWLQAPAAALPGGVTGQ